VVVNTLQQSHVSKAPELYYLRTPSGSEPTPSLKAAWSANRSSRLCHEG
jgi:hypothetical protein